MKRQIYLTAILILALTGCNTGQKSSVNLKSVENYKTKFNSLAVYTTTMLHAQEALGKHDFKVRLKSGEYIWRKNIEVRDNKEVVIELTFDDSILNKKELFVYNQSAANPYERSFKTSRSPGDTSGLKNTDTSLSELEIPCSRSMRFVKFDISKLPYAIKIKRAMLYSEIENRWFTTRAKSLIKASDIAYPLYPIDSPVSHVSKYMPRIGATYTTSDYSLFSSNNPISMTFELATELCWMIGLAGQIPYYQKEKPAYDIYDVTDVVSSKYGEKEQTIYFVHSPYDQKDLDRHPFFSNSSALKSAPPANHKLRIEYIESD